MRTFIIFSYFNIFSWLIAGIFTILSNIYGINIVNYIIGGIFIIFAIFCYFRYKIFFNFFQNFLQNHKYSDLKSIILYEIIMISLSLFVGIIFMAMIFSRFFGEKMSIFG